jgi:hypothetical protein
LGFRILCSLEIISNFKVSQIKFIFSLISLNFSLQTSLLKIHQAIIPSRFTDSKHFKILFHGKSVDKTLTKTKQLKGFGSRSNSCKTALSCFEIALKMLLKANVMIMSRYKTKRNHKTRSNNSSWPTLQIGKLD